MWKNNHLLKKLTLIFDTIALGIQIEVSPPKTTPVLVMAYWKKKRWGAQTIL